jgi:hypothetical protein
MLRKFAIGFVAALAWLALAAGTGCDMKNTPDPRVALPQAPQYYRDCFAKVTAIPATQITRDQVVQLVAKLRKSELGLSKCGKDLLAWYDKVVATYGRKVK